MGGRKTEKSQRLFFLVRIPRSLGRRAGEKGESEQVVEELPGLVVLCSNGSVVRHESSDLIFPIYSISSSTAATDFSLYGITLNPTTKHLGTRLLPSGDHRRRTGSPLPIVLHFHGGGFCVGFSSWRMYHKALGQLCASSGAIWVSVAYRFAPENRLPAGFLDCQEAFNWLRQLPDLAQPNDSTAALLRRRGDLPEESWVGGYNGGEKKSELL